MAKTKTITIECPKCREAFEIKGYETINASLDEALKAKLMTGEIFLHTCPKCGESFGQPYSMTYQDMEREFFLVLDIGSINAEVVVEEAKEMFPGYKIRVDTDLMDFLEKVQIFEANLNDKIIVYLDNKIYEDVTCKLAQNQSPIQVQKILYDSFNIKQKKINFGAISNSVKPIFIGTPYGDYKQLANSPGLIPHFKEKPGEYKINRMWARQLG